MCEDLFEFNVFVFKDEELGEVIENMYMYELMYVCVDESDCIGIIVYIECGKFNVIMVGCFLY